jgi:fatty acid-binding protein DegV
VSSNHHIQLITDGTAYLSAARLRELGIISLPIVAQANGRNFMYDQQTDGHIDLLTELEQSRSPVEIIGPSPDDFRAVFERTYVTDPLFESSEPGYAERTHRGP